MAKKFLGKTLDLHHGGVDLMFPHHENEIAQSEAANNCSFCNNWLHNEFLNFGTEKMSKSLGNVIKIRDFVDKYGGQVLRHILLSVHYRARLEWTDEVLNRALDEVTKIHEFVLDAKNILPQGDYSSEEISGCVEKMMDELSNDFNSAGAMGHFFTFMKNVRAHKDELSSSSVRDVRETITFVQDALGLISHNPEMVLSEIKRHMKDISSTGIDADWIDALIMERKLAKEAKNWARADEIRKEMASKNIILKDNPDGTTSWSVQG
jgi:cysteinyl-tRNA synthetase